MSQCARWFATYPGHILAESRLASIPIETPHGSALGRRQLAERRRADARIDIRRTPGPESEGDKASRNPAIIMLGMGWRLRRPLVLHMPHPERTGASRKLQ